MKQLKYLAKLHLVCCAVFSQQNVHSEAIEHAKYGVIYAHQAILEAQQLTEKYQEKAGIHMNNKKNQPIKNSSFILEEQENPNNENSVSLLESAASKMLPIIQELLKRAIQVSDEGKAKIPKEANPKKINMRYLFGFMQCNESIMGLNIGNIMQISPLCLQDLHAKYDKEIEISRELLMEKIALLSVAYFCLSTEKRFLAQEAGRRGQKFTQESEFWHAKSLEIACCFLPGDCPLVGHIYMSYQKHHSLIQQMIVF